jgi:hypothetical protein
MQHELEGEGNLLYRILLGKPEGKQQLRKEDYTGV